MSYLKKQTCIPWSTLQAQFGADYKQARQFKAAFLKQLRSVLVLYPACKADEDDNGLILKPSPPHVALLNKPVD